jgi:hypothetical protein
LGFWHCGVRSGSEGSDVAREAGNQHPSLAMPPYTLRNDLSEQDDSWRFTLPERELRTPKRIKPKAIYGKIVKFTVEAITLEMTQLPNNRILQDDDPSKFILASFYGLRFPEAGAKATKEYINRLMKAGFFLNNVQYRFYHHSNSQLVRRASVNCSSCKIHCDSLAKSKLLSQASQY